MVADRVIRSRHAQAHYAGQGRWLLGCAVALSLVVSALHAGPADDPAATGPEAPMQALKIPLPANVPPAASAPTAPPALLPPAMPVDPHFRLSLLPAAATPAGATPHPTEKMLHQFGEFVEGTVDPQNNLDLVIGRPRLLMLKVPPKRIQIGNPEIASLLPPDQPVAERQLSLVGKQVGTTILNLWFVDPQAPAKEKILSYLVRVIPDPEAKHRLEAVYKALEVEINAAFPNSVVHLALVGDVLVVSGQAKDAPEAAQILNVVRANAPRPSAEARGQPTPASVALATAQVNLDGARTETVQTPLEAVAPAAGCDIINLLHVPGERQVMLRVTVAEVNRAAARSIGIDFIARNNQGLPVVSQLTGGIFGSANLPLLLDGGQLAIAIQAMRNLNFARTLAEPSMTALSGQTATFHAGGEFPMSVVTGYTAAGLQGVTYVPYGVTLNFTPIVTDKNRIRLQVQAAVSTRELETVNIAGSQVPRNLNTRNFQTAVELREGQTLAVAGLIQSNFAAQSDRVPLFGDLPIIGRLAAFDRTQASEQELIVLITPELVHPLDCKETPPLPGSDLIEPNDLEFYLFGRLESHRAENYRSPIRTDLERMKLYRKLDCTYIIGPQGHADGHR